MTPKIIHQIWIQGCENLPEKYKNYSDKWKLQENYQYICWNDKTIRDLINIFDKTLLDSYNYFDLLQQKSDLARYIILYLFGGVYIDMDIEPGNISLDNVLNLNKPLIMAKGGSTIASQNFMVSVKNHPLFKDLINHIKINYKKKWFDILTIYVQRTTGGLIYQKLLDNYSNDYIIIPQNLVYRCESIDDCKIDKNIVAMIHFEKSWNILLYSQRFIEYYKNIIFTNL